MADRRAGGVEQGLARTGAAMAGSLAVARFAAAPGVWRQAEQRGDLLATEQAQRGQIGDQRGRGDRPDAMNLNPAVDSRRGGNLRPGLQP